MGKTYRNVPEGQINALLAEADRMGQAKGWKKGFASAVALLVLGVVVAIVLARVFRLV